MKLPGVKLSVIHFLILFHLTTCTMDGRHASFFTVCKKHPVVFFMQCSLHIFNWVAALLIYVTVGEKTKIDFCFLELLVNWGGGQYFSKSVKPNCPRNG